jgi:hypothetical protein
MAYVVGVITDKGLVEFHAKTLEEHKKNLEYINSKKWRIKYAASGRYVNSELLERARARAMFGEEQEEPVYIEAGKEVTVSSGLAKKMQESGLIPKDVEIKEGKMYIVSKSDDKPTPPPKIQIPEEKPDLSILETKPEFRKSSTQVVTSTPIPKGESLQDIKTREIIERKDTSIPAFITREVATKITPIDPFGVVTLYTAGKGVLKGESKEK